MKITTKLFYTFFLNAILFTIVFIISVVVSRLLGPEKYGLFRFIILIATTITLIGNFGLPEMLQLKLAQKIIDLKAYLTNVLISTTPTYLVILFVTFYFIIREDSIDNNLVISGLIYCLIHQIHLIFHNSIYALDKIIIYQLFDIIKQSFFLISIIAFLLFKTCSLENMLWILIFANSFSITYILYLYIKIPCQKLKKNVFTKELIANSLKTYLNNILIFLTYRVNLYFLKFFVGFYEIGIYSLSVTLVEKLWILPESIRAVLYLELSNQRRGHIFVAQLLRIITLIIIVICIVLASVAHKVIPFVFSDKYAPSVLPFVVMLPGVMLFCFSKIISSFFIIQNLILKNTVTSVIIAIINLVLNILLIPQYFVLGAAIATSVAYFIGSLYHIYQFKITTRLKYHEIFLIRYTDIKYIGALSNKTL